MFRLEPERETRLDEMGRQLGNAPAGVADAHAVAVFGFEIQEAIFREESERLVRKHREVRAQIYARVDLGVIEVRARERDFERREDDRGTDAPFD